MTTKQKIIKRRQTQMKREKMMMMMRSEQFENDSAKPQSLLTSTTTTRWIPHETGQIEVWKERIARGEEGEIVLPPTPKAKTIMSGFRIISMTMRDAESGDKIWETRDWGEERYAEETRADVPI